ncbi:MAG: hypothetical protein Alpg2KO_16360 [Alphaproteobacteria bacterium]
MGQDTHSNYLGESGILFEDQKAQGRKTLYQTEEVITLADTSRFVAD